MTKLLRISYLGEILAELEWSRNVTRIVTTTPSLQAELKKFISEGLSEWQGQDSDAKPVRTPSKDHRFLDRLASYITRQFNFSTTVIDTDTLRIKP